MILHGNIHLKYWLWFITGSYQPQQGQGVCDTCPSGTYCDPYELNNVTGIIVPQDCIQGHYCPNGTEYAQQNKCPNGTYSNQTALASAGMYALLR